MKYCRTRENIKPYFTLKCSIRYNYVITRARTQVQSYLSTRTQPRTSTEVYTATARGRAQTKDTDKGEHMHIHTRISTEQYNSTGAHTQEDTVREHTRAYTHNCTVT